MGLSGWDFTIQGNPLCLYPAGRHLGSTSLYLFTDFTDCRPYHSRGLDLGGWGLYLRAHHRDYLQLYRHRDWLCHYLLSGALYGAAFVQSVVSKRTYDKYIGWLDKGNRFDRFFIFMMIWPISPADFLCMLAALTKMSFKRYMTIIILTKPFTLVVYTYGLTYIIDFFWQML
ncbi:hypothetical protein D061_04921 [Streptococcus pneumoniae 1488]|nr:hypothetical protein D061_04921 [Streptococcus pneumoniae 1488]